MGQQSNKSLIVRSCTSHLQKTICFERTSTALQSCCNCFMRGRSVLTLSKAKQPIWLTAETLINRSSSDPGSQNPQRFMHHWSKAEASVTVTHKSCSMAALKFPLLRRFSCSERTQRENSRYRLGLIRTTAAARMQVRSGLACGTCRTSTWLKCQFTRRCSAHL